MHPDKHTANLVIDPLPSINGNKDATIQQKPQHNLIPITAQQTKYIRPGGLLQSHDILIREARHKARYTARGGGILSQGGRPGSTLIPMGQQMLGLSIGDAIAIEQNGYDEVDYLGGVSFLQGFVETEVTPCRYGEYWGMHGRQAHGTR